MKKHGWFMQVLIAFDQLLNAFARGRADETLSARAYRSQHKPYWRWFMKIVDFAFFHQKEHCKLAHEAEIRRAEFPAWHRKE